MTDQPRDPEPVPEPATPPAPPEARGRGDLWTVPEGEMDEALKERAQRRSPPGSLDEAVTDEERS